MNMKKCTVKNSLFRENIPVETYESISKSYEKHQRVEQLELNQFQS